VAENQTPCLALERKGKNREPRGSLFFLEGGGPGLHRLAIADDVVVVGGLEFSADGFVFLITQIF